MEMRLPPDFKGFLSSLNKNSVRYLLVGGWAVSIHGYVRFTNDLDVWIEATETNAKAAELAIREFGFDVPELSSEAMLAPKAML